MNASGITIGKFEQGCINEDAVLAKGNIIAVSDGAGGGGLFAERWSRYMLEHLPDTPIQTAEELDNWLEQIWEPFYNQCEADAKMLGSMSLEKFYDEGAFATLAAIWRTGENLYQWMSYGDSVAFLYDFKTCVPQHSFSTLDHFDNPPFLINCKDAIDPRGFRNGEWTVPCGHPSLAFVTSDALAHYILMMYEICHKEDFHKEILDALARHSKNGNYIKAAEAMSRFDFERTVLKKLTNCVHHPTNLKRHLQSLIRKGLLALDDYSFAVYIQREVYEL